MNQRRYFGWMLTLLLLAAFFIPLGLAPLFDIDEGAFSEATREMSVNGDYITTYLNGALRFDKPILIYWLQLVSMKIFGVNEFAFRLPSAIAGVAWVATVYAFCKRHWDEKIAFTAALFMIAALQVNMIAKAAIADGLLNALIAMSMFAIFYYYQTRAAKWIYATFLLIGLGALTKGPVAILIPLAVSALFFGIKREWRLWFKAMLHPIGIAIFLAIVLPWYLAEYHAQGQLFIDGFFLKHNVGRFSEAMETHSGSVLYYIPVVILGLLPFTFFVFKALTHLRALVREDVTLYLLLWFGFVLVFFSVSSTKLPHYVVYGYTPALILGALYAGRPFHRVWVALPLMFFLVLLAFLPEIAGQFKSGIKDALVVHLIELSGEVFNIVYRSVLLGLAAMVLLAWGVRRSNMAFLVTIAAVMVFAMNYVLVPKYGELMQSPIKEAGVLARQNGVQNVVMYKINMPSFNVYYQGLVQKKNQAVAGDVVLTKVNKLNDFPRYDALYQKYGFALVRVGQ